MGNVSELLINTVSINKPKLLSGLNQNGVWLVISVRSGDTSSFTPPVKRQALTQSCDR